MKNSGLIFISWIYVASCGMAQSYVYIEDGGYHLLNDNTYRYDHVMVDFSIANDPGTCLKLTGGVVDSLTLYNNSALLFTGGVINKGLTTDGRCSVTMSGGSVGWDFHAFGSDVVNISGGAIGDDLFSRGHSVITLSGGTVKTNIVAIDSGLIYLNGSNLRVNGELLYPGVSLRNYGVPGGTQNSYWKGTIIGTLQNGSSINNTFFIQRSTNADIIIIPEPGTMVLMVFGGLWVARRRNRVC
jgi:hypothetical protein